MGDRFRLNFIANLKTESRHEFEQVCAVMVTDPEARELELVPVCDFFTRGTYVDFCRATSAYCPGATVREWDYASSRSTPQKAEHRITIVGQTRYRREIHEFLEWVHPFIDADEFDYLGSILFSEFAIPSLLHYHPERIHEVCPSEFERYRAGLMDYLY